MRNSVERLRVGLLVGAGLLVVVIAAFLGYARYRVRLGLANLPGRLGATITRESNGYTYSQSDGKKTIFTLHAAKAVEHADGKYALHDVDMVLYGHTGDRADHISGSDFEYDTKAEVVRAVGTVNIDLQAPVKDGAGGGGGEAEDRVVHVTTSGLVYVKKQAMASTTQGIDFSFGGLTGHAVGAEYNSDSGHLVLQSEVKMSGLARDRPIALAATHGELDREKNRADFSDVRYSSAGEVAQAEVAHLYMRKDGSVERIEGVRHVMLEDTGRGSATCDHADVVLDAVDKPRNAVLIGNVHFTDDEPLRQARGDSESADLGFDEHGNIHHAVLHGRVHTYERVQGAGAKEVSERTLTADRLELLLAAEGEGKPLLREAKATGSAHLRSVATGVPTAGAAVERREVPERPEEGGTATNSLSADALDAHFAVSHGAAELSTVHGEGHTVLEQTAAGGLHQTSTGGRLDVSFREVAGEPSAGNQGAVEVATGMQEGNVVIDRILAPKSTVKPGTAGSGTAPEIQHATAGRASYNADSGEMTLTEDVRMSDAASTISAARVVLKKNSGDATADGLVKVTYLQTESSDPVHGPEHGSEYGPVHVLAAHAELNHDAGSATFYGRTAGTGVTQDSGLPQGAGLARMWQAGTGQQGGAQAGGSQIEAPVLVFEREAKRLTARAEKPGQVGQVHTVLARAASGSRPAAAQEKSKAAKMDEMESARSRQQSTVRITSSAMIYSDNGSHAGRQAEFTGGVRVVDSDGEMRARQATVFLTSASGGGEKTSKAESAKGPQGPNANGLLGGEVERIVATQNIEITQPGRRATGDRLVYTASDELFVLTGTAAAPPRVVDAAQGSTSGTALQFHTGDDSVSVLGSSGEAPTQKAHTETHVGTHVAPHAATGVKQ